MITLTYKDLGLICITSTSDMVVRGRLASAILIFGGLDRAQALHLCSKAGFTDTIADHIVEEVFG